MGRICEGIVRSFIEVFFGEKKEKTIVIEKKDEYTLSSVFPTKKIMKEAKKYLWKAYISYVNCIR